MGERRRLNGAVKGRLGRILVQLGIGIGVAVIALALALSVTPDATVSAAGQTVRVGAAPPSLSFSGPGELDLFGQQLPTAVNFDGPVRPRLVLTHISVNDQLASLFAGHKVPIVGQSLGQALASGWARYFVWEAVAAGCAALLLVGALAGWFRVPWRRMLVLLGAGLVLTEAVNVGAVMVATVEVPARLSHVSSLEALVGRTPLATDLPARGPRQPVADAVVLGDSTAAGLGNPLVPDATPSDRACGRSVDSYANDLAIVNGWHVLNLACAGATIDAGLLGPQKVGKMELPPQVVLAERETRASLVIVSVGANDVGWSELLAACAGTQTCDNAAFTAYFQQQLAAFSSDYLRLLQQLESMPGHPRVLVNLYYNPFDPAKDCLGHVGLNHAKERAVNSLLGALNSVLAKGAAASAFTAVQPSFAGHALCDGQSYVQGLDGPAPFHPTPGGELVIALSDEHQLATSNHAGVTPSAS